MAFGRFEYFSDCLKRTVSFSIILSDESETVQNRKVLYLLHGYNGISSDWILNSHVYEVANKYHLCIVMPSGENSFYLDADYTGGKYATFIGEELPAYIRNNFKVTDKREETFIGGFSMGGFGAIHTVLAYRDTYEKAFALSSALIMEQVKQMRPGYENDIANYEYYHHVFGDPEKLENSVNNPKELVRRISKDKSRMPEIYMACGTEDFLYKENKDFAAFLKEYGQNFTYVEDTGIHDFHFWDRYLEPAVRWLLNIDQVGGEKE